MLSTACAVEALQVAARDAIGIRNLRGDRAAEIGGKSSDAALARQMIAEDRDSTRRTHDGSVVHDSPTIEARSGSSPDHLNSQPNRDDYDPEHQKQAHHINSSSPTFRN